MNILTNHPPTEELQRIDAAHHMHPFSANAELGKKGARVITRATGCHLTDSEGEQLLDAMAGLWCVNIGYGRHELAEAAARQMKELPYYNTFFQTTTVPALALGERLAGLAPANLNTTFFASSGSEANDTNIRLVRHYWALMGKPTKRAIISRVNAYHGSSMGSASLGGMAVMHAQGGMPIPDIHHVPQPHWWGEGGDMDPEAFGIARAREVEAKILELGPDNVAAFIGEPIQGAGGVILPPDSYWPEIQRICKDHDVLLIADEVINGFGRLGSWFGIQKMGIEADVMTIAKGLSSGYAPIAGSMVSDRVADVIGADEFSHGYTYSGHPVSCAVALENIRIIEDEDMIGAVNGVNAPALGETLAKLGEHELVGDVTHFGMLGALQLTPDASARAAFAAPKGTMGLIARGHAFDEGLVMRHVGDRLICSPPLIFGPSEAAELLDKASRVLDKTLADAKAQGLMVAA